MSFRRVILRRSRVRQTTKVLHASNIPASCYIATIGRGVPTMGRARPPMNSIDAFLFSRLLLTLVQSYAKHLKGIIPAPWGRSRFDHGLFADNRGIHSCRELVS